MRFLRVCMSLEPRDVVDVPCDEWEVNEDNSITVYYDGNLYGFFSDPEYSYVIDDQVLTEEVEPEDEAEPDDEEPDDEESGETVELISQPQSLNGSYAVEAAPNDIAELDDAPPAVEEPGADAR